MATKVVATAGILSHWPHPHLWGQQSLSGFVCFVEALFKPAFKTLRGKVGATRAEIGAEDYGARAAYWEQIIIAMHVYLIMTISSSKHSLLKLETSSHTFLG